MSEPEQDHIVDAYTFELGHVEVPAVVERMVMRLALIDVELARRVSIGLGVPAPTPRGIPGPVDDVEIADPELDVVPDATGGVEDSPARAMVTDNVYPVDGRIVQILANDGCDLAGIRAMQAALIAAGAVPHVALSSFAGIVPKTTDWKTLGRGNPQPVTPPPARVLGTEARAD